MSHNMLEERKELALVAKYAVDRSTDAYLVESDRLGRSYPLGPEETGVWIAGPDGEGRYVVNVSIAVTSYPIPNIAHKLRQSIVQELRDYGLFSRVKAVDIYIEDLVTAV